MVLSSLRAARVCGITHHKSGGHYHNHSIHAREVMCKLDDEKRWNGRFLATDARLKGRLCLDNHKAWHASQQKALLKLHCEVATRKRDKQAMGAVQTIIRTRKQPVLHRTPLAEKERYATVSVRTRKAQPDGLAGRVALGRTSIRVYIYIYTCVCTYHYDHY